MNNGGDEWLESLRNVDYEEAVTQLIKLPGVGRKVSDMIPIIFDFSFEIFPRSSVTGGILVLNNSFRRSLLFILLLFIYFIMFFIVRRSLLFIRNGLCTLYHCISCRYCSEINFFNTIKTTESIFDEIGLSGAC